MNATIALAVQLRESGDPELVEILFDLREITILESAVSQQEPKPLALVYEHRERLAKEDDEFSNYVETLLSRPFQKPEVQEHGVQWLKSRIRIERFQQHEKEAARIIADYAFEIYRAEMARTDFLLAGPRTEVRIRVFILEGSLEGSQEVQSVACRD